MKLLLNNHSVRVALHYTGTPKTTRFYRGYFEHSGAELTKAQLDTLTRTHQCLITIWCIKREEEKDEHWMG